LKSIENLGSIVSIGVHRFIKKTTLLETWDQPSLFSGFVQTKMNNNNQLRTAINQSGTGKSRKGSLGNVSVVFLLLSLIPQQILTQIPGSLEIVNTTKDTLMFSDDFESHTTGGAPEADTPKVGTWN